MGEEFAGLRLTFRLQGSSELQLALAGYVTSIPRITTLVKVGEFHQLQIHQDSGTCDDTTRGWG
ncbi:hypothetical protein GRAN_4997 [Granulicella sibirica]|uniref:Uncharacterized protein n=1 Tax=Granulicella sibirica TaxID=2479048 RepID=A0A4Q0SWS6_9BACT|nr:hypothetical protein GRAN_4997 [Granulicella sibirica]